MKKIICILLMGLLLAGCVQPYDGAQNSDTEARPTVTVTYYSEPTAMVPLVEIPAIANYEAFMEVISAAVLDGRGNKNLSPVSVYLALAMACEGARGQTEAELLALLGAQDAADMRSTAIRPRPRPSALKTPPPGKGSRNGSGKKPGRR